MLFFTNCKINIGLNITEKRLDGFHNLETVFYPLKLQDAVEFIETDEQTTVQTSGIKLDVSAEDNICHKVYRLMSKHYDIPQLKIHVHKAVPVGAGLGGGSANAAGLIKQINNEYNLGISIDKMEELAAEIGSDCPFFIRNKAVFAIGRGEIFEQLSLDLSKYYIYLIKPDIYVSTASAFAGIKPRQVEISVKELINNPLNEWKYFIFNDFETNIFKQYPVLAEIKQDLYKIGAIYASMSGSGSTIYGIFEEKPKEIPKYKNAFNWINLFN